MATFCVVQDRLWMGFEIEGQSLPEIPNLVQSISIHESVNAATPVMQFTFSDQTRSMVKQLALTEGTKANLILGKYANDAATYGFRLFGLKHTAAAEGPKVVANFILDCPEYLTGAYTEGYEGTSSSVIAKIADKCGFTPVVSATSDAMNWLNFGQTRAAFTEDIAIHGYGEDSGCMFRALTSKKALVYKDAFFEINSTPPDLVLALNNVQGSDIIQVRDTRNVSVSGVMNSWVNYGWQYTEHSLKGKAKVNDKYDVQTSEAFLPINSDVKSAIDGQTRVEYCRKLDCRNTHDNYNKAYYNNMRGRALLGERMHLLIEEPSDLQLLDTVEYRQWDSDGTQGKDTGVYNVTGKVAYVTHGSFYYEKLEICRAALRENGATNLVG